MNAYKEEPQLALATLEKIAEEIPAGVSAGDIGQIIRRTGPYPDELADFLREDIAAELKSNLHTFWTSRKVSEKLEMVKTLKCTNVDVRPPTSRQDTSNVINAKYLKLLKEAFVVRIEKIKEENRELERVLKEKAELINQQMEEIKACDFTL